MSCIRPPSINAELISNKFVQSIPTTAQHTLMVIIKYTFMCHGKYFEFIWDIVLYAIRCN